MSITGRSTSDLVLLIFALIIGAAVLVLAVGVVLLELQYPDADTSVAVTSLGQIVAIVIGVVVGFVAGRRPSESQAKP